MMRRRRLVSGLAAVAAASLASGQTPARPYRAATMSRERPHRIVICPLPRRAVLIAAGTAMLPALSDERVQLNAAGQVELKSSRNRGATAPRTWS
jgi:hypothetical protein